MSAKKKTKKHIFEDLEVWNRAGIVNELAEESRGMPDEFMRRLKKDPAFVFVHSYPNLDRVLQGGDLLSRAKLWGSHTAGVIVVSSDKLKQGTHVFLGLPGLRGVAKGYVEKIEGAHAYIVGMDGRLEI